MIRIFIADDHNVVREGIISLLERETDLKVVGEASDGMEAVEKIKRIIPDVVVMDISLPSLNGIEATERLMAEGFAGKILILTQYEKEEYIRLAMHAGASGYLVKDSLAKDVLDAIRSVVGGELYFSPSISRMLLTEYVQKAKNKPTVRRNLDLTSREIEVLQLIAEGFSSRQIADKLSVGTRTVEFHRANIIQKLGIRDVAGLTKYAIKHGLVKI